MKSITTVEQFNEVIKSDAKHLSNSRQDGALTARAWICSLIQLLKNTICIHGMTWTVMYCRKLRRNMM